MKIVTVHFDYPGQNKYEIMLQVFAHSVGLSNPNADLEIVRIPPPEPTRSNSRSFASNTVKIAEWLRVVNETDDDIVFMDCDMMVVGDLSPAFASADFDIGYTKRTGNRRIPNNGGVVFVRNTQKARDFIALWKKVNDRMYEDKGFHYPWRAKYAGINQAAFGCIFETMKFEAVLKEFPCRIWNACLEDWAFVDESTKAIHVKSGLRRAVFNERRMDHTMPECVRIWNKMIASGGVKTPVARIDKIVAHVGNPPSMTPQGRYDRDRGVVRRGRRLSV